MEYVKICVVQNTRTLTNIPKLHEREYRLFNGIWAKSGAQGGQYSNWIAINGQTKKFYQKACLNKNQSN